mmetsp:Transcript_36873/g.82013  ORF Transcript_36873/g.82013 Transcript_36873/m.82013 type:complete len:122 (+) Transcript_36873:39-404(+)
MSRQATLWNHVLGGKSSTTAKRGRGRPKKLQPLAPGNIQRGEDEEGQQAAQAVEITVQQIRTAATAAAGTLAAAAQDSEGSGQDSDGSSSDSGSDSGSGEEGDQQEVRVSKKSRAANAWAQ